VVADPVRTRRRDQREEPFDELAALHQDVGGAVSPSGLEPQCECAVLTLLESFAREEALQLLAHDLVKKSLLRLMALVLGHEVPDRDRVEECAVRKLEPICRHGIERRGVRIGWRFMRWAGAMPGALPTPRGCSRL
jgi:hypothetical protein